MWDVFDPNKRASYLYHNRLEDPRGIVVSGGQSSKQGDPIAKIASAGNTERFNPVRDQLSEGTVIEDWIPRDPAQINLMMRLIYIRDEIAGPTTDLFAELPWSEVNVSGIRDRRIHDIYESWIQCMDPRRVMPELSIEYLVIGRDIATMSFNETLGYWDSIIVQNPDNIRIDPIPVHGVDPKLDLKIDSNLLKFLQSKDPRDMAARKKLSPKLLKQMQNGSGYVPLDPDNTLFIPRKAGASDFIGTSFYTRLLTWWALQKPLVNASAIGARRKSGGTTHVTMGIDGKWEPTPTEMADVMRLFISAEEDPISGIVVTREGVQVNRLDSNQSIWKLSDDYSFISEGKMKALGINEAFLSGDANFTTMETALSVLLERIKTLRSLLTYAFFIRKAKVLARVHGFRKTKEKNVTASNVPFVRLSEKDASSIPDSELILPRLDWQKKLQPVADENYLQILDTMEQKGLPITTRTWASAGGLSISDLEEGLAEDVELRKKFAEWKRSFSGGSDDESMAMASYNHDGPGTLLTAGSLDSLEQRLPLWGHKGKFLGLTFKTAKSFVNWVIQNPKSVQDKDFFYDKIKAAVGSDKMKRLALRYVLARVGLYPLRNLKMKYAKIITHAITANNSGITGKDYRKVRKEMTLVSAMTTKDVTERKELSAKEASLSRDVKRRFGAENLPDRMLASGYVDKEFTQYESTL